MEAIAVKMLATAVVVIGVTLSVGHLGPRLGGIIAGTPIVLAPAFFFLGREQSPAFVAEAAVSALHALTATLVFTMCYVLAAARLGAISSILLSILGWMASALVFSRIPGGVGTALLVYAGVFGLAMGLDRYLRLPPTRAAAPNRWPDLIFRGVLAGVLVGVATTVATGFGPLVSGTLTGFPVGFITIALTLQQRFGVATARATIATAQRGMFSLIAFAATAGLTAETLGGLGAFFAALAASLGLSAAMFALIHLHQRMHATRGHQS
ncbi:hypothetical protein QWY84_07575 [Aquisalimonas lutea]|uniref:hypothetical protein n=1 Tax=Aquisalimonas lutea TaxID=1327750 RepID=UPI0025B35B19|nr:hypothetical protein [Aquisalimonas lutea]MDN3517462.1 hypothetical protein [Aquisalimonas lutea]